MASVVGIPFQTDTVCEPFGSRGCQCPVHLEFTAQTVTDPGLELRRREPFVRNTV